jgi:hypothetical protein
MSFYLVPYPILDGIEAYLDIFGICGFLEIIDGLVVKSNLAGSTRWAQPSILPLAHVSLELFISPTITPLILLFDF